MIHTDMKCQSSVYGDHSLVGHTTANCEYQIYSVATLVIDTYYMNL